MADGLNKVMLLGRLCVDPELRFTAAGQGVLNIRLATNDSYLDRDKNRVERVEYHMVTVWGKRGEGLAKILTKGTMIFVEGSLHTSSYEKDGDKRYKTEINATNIILVGGKRSDEGSGDGGGGDNYEGGDGGGYEQPQQNGGQRAQGKPSGGGYGRQGNNNNNGGGGSQGGGRSQGVPQQQQQRQQTQRAAAPQQPPPEDNFTGGYSDEDQIPF